MPGMSLEELNRQIAQRERELKTLRQELESRRDHFAALTRRKEELLSQLKQVESEIATLNAAPTERAKPTKPTVSPTPSPAAQPKDRPRLGELILTTLRKSGKAMTARELCEEVRRQGFPLSGTNPVKSVESRLQEMKQKHLVQRAKDQPGYVLTASNNGNRIEKPKTSAPAPKESQKTTGKSVKPAPTTKPASSGQDAKSLPLRQVLTNVLKSKSGKYLSGSELAELVLATGYKTKSSKFVDSVWSMLGQMENVEHVRGKGYRLKKG